MNDTVKERLITFISYKGLSKNAFEKRCSLSPRYVSNISVSIQPEKVKKISIEFPELNTGWLLTGEGEMLKKEDAGGRTNLTRSYDVPLLPIYAKGGTLSDFAFSVMSWECERIMCPIQEAQLAMSITGDSMEPEYPSGSYVFIKKVNENSFIEWGKVYVLDTCNGAILKRVYPGKRDDLLLCKSNNADYPDFEVNRGDVFGLYRVLLMMALK